MKKNKIRLTESQLHRVIKEATRKVLNEDYDGQLDANDMADIQRNSQRLHQQNNNQNMQSQQNQDGPNVQQLSTFYQTISKQFQKCAQNMTNRQYSSDDFQTLAGMANSIAQYLNKFGY